MALLLMILRKMKKNLWLVLCLLLGLVICVALVSSIPIYTQGALQKMIVRDLENYQQENNIFPGIYRINISMDYSGISNTVYELKTRKQSLIKNEKVLDFYKGKLKTVNEARQYTEENIKQRLGLPIIEQIHTYSTDIRRMHSEDPKKTSPTGGSRYATIESMSGLYKNINLLDGKLPSNKAENGVYEALVTEEALKKLGMVLGEVFVLIDNRYEELEGVKIKPVGVFTIKDDQNMYWSLAGTTIYDKSFFIDEGLMEKDFINTEPTMLQSMKWLYAYDYHAIDSIGVGDMLGGHRSFSKGLRRIIGGNNVDIEAPSMDIINNFLLKENQLNVILLALNIPVIIMLFLYLFMVSKLIIDREKNEIALLNSRGANRFQIVLGYFIEGLILGGIAFAVGPWIGMLISKILGASNGFLEFTSRASLPAAVSSNAYAFAAVAAGLSLLTMLIPAYLASKTNIISYKTSIARKKSTPFWKKYFIDLVLIAVSLYGYYSFGKRQEVMKITGAASKDIQIDPMLFFVPAMFILGVGLVTLRLYPLIVKAIYWIGRKLWPPSVYATLIQVGRSLESYHFLMIFMVMTLSIGLFSSTAARTINSNTEERVNYAIGSDMVIKTLWQTDVKPRRPLEPPPNKKPNYFEPSFLPYTQMLGVKHAAKVFNKDDVTVISEGGQRPTGARLMGIEPYDFGNVVWYRDGLMPHHINEYINLLAVEPSACLISKSLSESSKLKVGDYIHIMWEENQKISFTVYGIVDYWPSWNPNKDMELNPSMPDPKLVVANLPYIRNHSRLEPYDVWLKLEPKAGSEPIYNTIKEKGISVTRLDNARQEVIKLKNNPFNLAINGALTLGFIISGMICFLGFLIYWVLSINARTLQFGIFRAIGLSVRKLNSMMVWEQALTSGAAAIIGVIIGLVASQLFVPFFQIAFNASTQVIPFKVVSFASDRMNVYLLVTVTMIIGLLALRTLLSRININQAIKLGEE
ncbi:MAG: ABC transporter permease [Clostridia bacterium]|nr:ABC transporter permease [Clostridia bacterium]